MWNVVDYANNKELCALKLSTSICHAQREHRVHSVQREDSFVTRVGLFSDTAFIVHSDSATRTLSKLAKCRFLFDTSGDSTLRSLSPVSIPTCSSLLRYTRCIDRCVRRYSMSDRVGS